MDTVQLNAYLRCEKDTRNYYLGAFAKDQIPRPPPGMNKFCFIVNSTINHVFHKFSLNLIQLFYGHTGDPHSKKGTHWMAVFKDGENVYFFCSFGKSPSFYNLSLKRYGKHVKYNKQQIQTFDNETCGLHAAFVLTQLCRGFSFDQILRELYNKNLTLNDHVVLLALCVHLKKHASRFCSE